MRWRWLLLTGGVMFGTMRFAAGAHAAVPAGQFRRLCADFWGDYLKTHPTFATSINVHDWDDQLEDITPQANERLRQRLQDFLDRAQSLDPGVLNDQEQVDRAALIEELQSELAVLQCDFGSWVVDAINGPQNAFNNLPDITTIQNGVQGRAYIARCKAIPKYLDDQMRNLRRGLQRRRVATHDAVRRVIEQIDAELDKPEDEWPLLRVLPNSPAGSTGASFSDPEFERSLREVVSTEVKPAYRRYRDFLAREILPAARPPEKPGIGYLPGGDQNYRLMMRVETSLPLTPEEVHALGLKLVAQNRADLATLGQKVLGTNDVAEIQKRLRGDPAMHFRTAAEIESKAESTLARAQAAVPQWFSLLPKAKCVVKVMGEHEAASSYVGYYREGTPDGSRPGNYVINTSQPETRTRYDAEALAFHESVPGHHLQIAIAQELTDLPEFRRHLGVTSFVEGWALYSERLADEMGLYSSDLDRIGMLSFDAWRDCRLVVDTGIHSMGWTRQQAIDYMRDNTVLAENNIENEVDRYINWPGQALAYKLGQLKILELRDEAKQKLGSRFDIREFHKALLENGAVALPVLQDRMESWIRAQQGR